VNLSTFFHSVRASVFGGSLTKGQVDGMERIINYRDERFSFVDNDQLAYVLATIYWETAHKMQPVREAGGERYLRTKKYYPWVGEGLVQVTWAENARKFGAKKPGDLMSWPIALFAAFEGMCKGMFTGKRLSDYIGGGRRDYVGARRIINGTDRAQEIAKIAVSFRAALVEAANVNPAPPPLPAPPFDQATFKTWLLEAMQSDEEVRAAVIAIVFPDEPEAYDPADEPHEEWGQGYEITDSVTQAEEPDPIYG
jgi:putative chitinase